MPLRHVHAFGFGAFVAAVLVGGIVLLAPSRRLMPEQRQFVAARLPETARAAMTSQMHEHARGMIELVSTVTVLDYDAVGESVRRLLGVPRVARPLAGDATELNAQLPARFFALQDELSANLEMVAQAASAHDAEALADGFAAASKTCIRRHDAYLTGR